MINAASKIKKPTFLSSGPDFRSVDDEKAKHHFRRPQADSRH
jgi:hypothetical protein